MRLLRNSSGLVGHHQTFKRDACRRKSCRNAMTERTQNSLFTFLGITAVLIGTRYCSAEDVPSKPDRAVPLNSDRLVLVVRGASGTLEYGRLFDAWSRRWETAASDGQAEFLRIGPQESDADSQATTKPDSTDVDRRTIIQSLARAGNLAQKEQLEELWIVLIGHGTFDGRVARFNLRGDDITSEELTSWLEPISCRIAIANCSSASGPFLNALAGRNRAVITATRSGAEINFSHFGEYLSEAIGNAAFDLDKDGQTSLFEAYLSASRRTEAFYEAEGRLATEHSLLDDNGDGLGIRADFFRGIRLVEKAEGSAAVDGQLAHRLHLVRSDTERQLSSETRRHRDRLELAITQLRDRKHQFENEDEYYAELEIVLVELAGIYEKSAEE